MAYIAWAMSGPYFDFSEAWRFSYFMGTSTVTFLTVFLARNAQIRSAKALHVKLDELIYAVKRADNGVIESEELTETELDQIRGRYHRLAQAAIATRSSNRPTRGERWAYLPAGRALRASRDGGVR
jgi:low affinity Fe/Cu permease